MFLTQFRSLQRHAPLFAVLAITACGGGGASTSSIPVITTNGYRTPEPIPTATPTPTPTAGTSGGMTMPTPAGTSVPSPTLAGLAPISSGVDVAAYVQPDEIPGEEPGDDVGAFRMVCSPSHNAYDDPIVYPGQPGRSHLHTFFGNTKADANSTYASLRTTGEGTCNNLLNRSAYWIPAMMNGKGKVVMPDYTVIYYKRLPANDLRCKEIAKACLSLPRGLRYIFGYNMSDPASTLKETYWWNCDGLGAVSGHFANIAQAAKGCPSGARLGAVLVAPNCWNGTELDSADHRSHMAYWTSDASGKVHCPATHPYLIPQFTLGAWYTTDDTLDRSGNESAGAQTWYLASDRMATMQDAVPGTTMHTDWFGAWEDSILALWHANCIDKRLSCNSGNLGNGTSMKGDYSFVTLPGVKLVDPPARN